jgi:Na+/H+-dicarboxylate symporter
MAKTLSSNQVSSKPNVKSEERELSIMYWARVVAGVIAGLISGYTHWSLPQPLGGIAIAMLTYLVLLVAFMSILRNPRLPRSKKLLHGVGSYSIWWFITYSIYITMVLA